MIKAVKVSFVSTNVRQDFLKIMIDNLALNKIVSVYIIRIK